MNILSIDTSASSFSLTLVKDGENITYVDSSDHISSETILVEINNLVTNCELKPKDINTVIYNNRRIFNANCLWAARNRRLATNG